MKPLMARTAGSRRAAARAVVIVAVLGADMAWNEGAAALVARPGISTDVSLASNVDGEAIAFTLHEPDTFRERERYPLLIHGHGYTDRRVTASDRSLGLTRGPLFAQLLAAGYAIISVDQRGHGDSGGTARVLDPDFEGRDLIQVLDWAEANVPWLRYRQGNLVLGSFGESYGGAFQLLIQRLDPRQRLDAMVPDITWHDLRYSFFGGEAFKVPFALGFNALAIQTSTRQDPFVTGLLAGGAATNRLTEEQSQFFRRVSPVAQCEDGQVRPVDVLFTQSAGDALFNFNEANANFDCYRAAGGDVRLWIKSAGHGLSVGGLVGLPVPVAGAGPSSTSQNCGKRDRNQAVIAWFDEKLKGRRNAASHIPQICAHLGQGGDDAVVLDRIQVGGALASPVPVATMVLQDGSQDELTIPLMRVEQDGEVFGGIPVVELSVLDPLLGPAGAGDPIVFIGIGVRRDGAVAPVNQLSPVRGYGTASHRLPGAFHRLRAGDELVLRLKAGAVFNYAGAGSRYPSPVTIGGTAWLPMLGVLPAAE